MATFEKTLSAWNISYPPRHFMYGSTKWQVPQAVTDIGSLVLRFNILVECNLSLQNLNNIRSFACINFESSL
jgi:hypothetical protein